MRWVVVEVVVKFVDVRVLMDKYWSNTGCETSLMGVDIGQGGFQSSNVGLRGCGSSNRLFNMLGLRLY